MAVFQSRMYRLIHRYRGQAPSHIGVVLLGRLAYLPPVICFTSAACPFTSSAREIAWITSN